MRIVILLLALLTTFFSLGAEAQAQGDTRPWDGSYSSTRPDGSAIQDGITVHFEIIYERVDWQGEHYVTVATATKNATGQIVAQSVGSLLVPHSEQVGIVTSGVTGNEGTLRAVGGGGGTDWTISYPGGNTRRLNRL